jgi:hypothetical protein
MPSMPRRQRHGRPFRPHRASGVDLDVIAHPAPAPLEDLWRRGDLGLAFICGYPFARGGFPVRPVAVPIPASGDGRPLYATHLLVRADSDIMSLQESFGRRLGWTVAHSQSGFNALQDASAREPAGARGALCRQHRPAADPAPGDRHLAGQRGSISARSIPISTTCCWRRAEDRGAPAHRRDDAPRPIPLLVASRGSTRRLLPA